MVTHQYKNAILPRLDFIAMDSQFRTLGQARRLSYEVYP